MLGKEQGDDAGNSSHREKPTGQENGNCCQHNLPKPEMHTLQWSFIADGGRRQRRSYRGHGSIMIERDGGFQGKIARED